MNPEPIETAPRDGTVILTDRGTCAYSSMYGWVLCEINGCFTELRDQPRLWTVLPAWMREPSPEDIQRRIRSRKMRTITTEEFKRMR